MMDQRQKQIMLGQSANLAMKKMKDHGELNFDKVFKDWTKRFYNLLVELNKEVFEIDNIMTERLCSDCSTNLTPKVLSYSLMKHGKALCYQCQNKK